MNLSVIFLLFLASALVFSNNFGSSRIKIERNWIVENAEDSQAEFNGTLAINNSNQRLLRINSEPIMEYEQDENGTIQLRYKRNIAQKKFIIKAIAIVDVDYRTNILTDSRIPRGKQRFTELTRPNSDIEAQAEKLAVENSSLETIQNLVSWVHNYIKYDANYWSKVKPARDVFQIKRGVCVEYTHLFIAMAGSLGFKTRYVAGYVNPAAWQSHAWAEVYLPEYGWISADPTFNELGILDNTHFAISYGQDQSSIYDSLVSEKTNVTLDVRDEVTMLYDQEDSKGLEVKINFDNISYNIESELKNTRSDFVFAKYEFAGHNIERQEIVLMRPFENIKKLHQLNKSIFLEGYSYSIPTAARLNDAKSNKIILIKNEKKDDIQLPIDKMLPCSLPTGFVLLLVWIKSVIE